MQIRGEKRRAKRYVNVTEDFKCFNYEKRDRDIWKRCKINKESMASIGRVYDVSRERIRQIVYAQSMVKKRRAIERKRERDDLIENKL